MRPVIPWHSDPNFWNALDGFAHLAWIPLKELMDVLYENQDEFNPMGQTLMFAGIGKFFKVFVEMRHTGLDPKEAYNVAIEAVQRDSRVQSMVQDIATENIDKRVNKMKEGANHE